MLLFIYFSINMKNQIKIWQKWRKWSIFHWSTLNIFVVILKSYLWKYILFSLSIIYILEGKISKKQIEYTFNFILA